MSGVGSSVWDLDEKQRVLRSSSGMDQNVEVIRGGARTSSNQCQPLSEVPNSKMLTWAPALSCRPI